MGWNPGVRGWFKACLRPCPSSLYEAQPTISRAAAVPFVRRSDESARKMVGWTPCKIVGPSISREVELATTPGYRPTHPGTLRSRTGVCLTPGPGRWTAPASRPIPSGQGGTWIATSRYLKISFISSVAPPSTAAHGSSGRNSERRRAAVEDAATVIARRLFIRWTPIYPANP